MVRRSRSRPRPLNPGRSLATWVFRHEGLAWLLLAVSVLYAAAVLAAPVLATRDGALGRLGRALPRLTSEFGFKAALRPDHPVRVEFERHEQDFGLRPQISVYFYGPEVFSPAFLAEADRFVAELQRRDDVFRVASPFDLTRPEARGTQVRLRRLLRPEVTDDPTRLADTLARPPFDGRWEGLLYDRAKTVFVMVVLLQDDEDDPVLTQDLMRSLEADLAAFAGRTGVDYRLNGLFWVNHEILRSTLENQGRLTALSLAVVLALLWLMFGSFAFAAASLGLLGVATLLVFVAMAHLGVPVNGLSGNLPLMILVIGLADLIHIAGKHAAGRRLYRPLGAALRAMSGTFLPNLFTSLTTFGCLCVMASTRLQILGHFAVALCGGVLLVYLVTIAYGPLVLARSGVRPGRGLYFRVQGWLEAWLAGWVPGQRGRLLAASQLGITVLLALAFSQRINSNWFRYFWSDQSVSRSLDFLQSRGFPVTSLELRIPTDRDVASLLEDGELAADMRALASRLEALEGVSGVYSLFGLKDQLDADFDEVEFPASLAPVWVEARRRTLYRQLVGFGALDDYHSLKTQDLRVVLTTPLEDARSLVELGDGVLAMARRAPLRGVDTSRIEAAGQMLYWSTLMHYVSTTFFASLLGSVGVVFLCFLALTGSLHRAALALIPNVLPVVAMFAVSKLMGYELSENFCLLVSLSIGIAVDDTLHFLFHLGRAEAEGMERPAAVRHAFEVAGAPIVLTSVLLMCGFSTCLIGTIVPTVLTGVFMNVSIATALYADLVLLPALLLGGVGEGEPPEGRARQAGGLGPLEVVEEFDLSEALSPQALEAVRSRDQPVLHPGFLAAYLEAPPEGVEPGLLVARDRRGRALAASWFARFRVNLDCLAPPGVQRAAAWVRQRVWSQFFMLDLLMFGMPAGLATEDTVWLASLDEGGRQAVRRALVERSCRMLAQEGATALVWKEFDAAGRAAWDPALTPELAAHPSVPSVKQELAFDSPEAYRAALRSGYRRQLDRNLRRAREAGLEVELEAALGPHVAAWYPLFREVVERSETRLEMLGEGFFEALAEDGSYRLNVARLEGRLVGGALCRVEGEDLHFLYVGMDYQRREGLDLYFNLLHSVVELACRHRCRRIHWGQTSLDAKGRFGGRAVPYWFALRFRNRLLDALVRAGSELLFPVREQAPRKVFRDA